MFFSEPKNVTHRISICPIQLTLKIPMTDIFIQQNENKP